MNRRMIALVVGNGNYSSSSAILKNPPNDANDLTQILIKLGFAVICEKDCSIEDIDRSTKSFKDSLNSNDVGLFYFAGHGMQIEGENYITGINTDFSDEVSAKWSSFPINKLIDLMEGSTNKTNIIILDACRNNPYERAWHRGVEARGLAPIFAPKGTMIAYSTSPGETASDGSGKNGAYTESLLKHIEKPDLPIEEMFKRVRNSLSLSTKGKQTSWEHTSLMGSFFFNLSLGKKIDKYDSTAIADDLFALDSSKVGHDAISNLKSYNWYTQNPALTALDSVTLENIDKDTLFVLGRNIYQAACGSSERAASFINNFQTKVHGVSTEKSLNLLEGILFEIFFNSKGSIRESFKVSRFNQALELQKYVEFSPAFEFISECLLPFSNRFYIIPGKQHADTQIEIMVEDAEDDAYKVTGVYFENDDVIREDERVHKLGDDEEVYYQPMKYKAFVDMLSEEMVIPKRLIKIESPVEFENDSRILFPYGHTVSK